MTVLLHIKKKSNEEYLPEAFKYFDKDGNGYIEMEELMEALGDDELGPDEQVIKDIIRDVDTDEVSLDNKLINNIDHLMLLYFKEVDLADFESCYCRV